MPTEAREKVREYPAHVITNVRDPSENGGNPAFAHPDLSEDT